MNKVNSKLILLLLLVIALAAYIKLSNPYRKYSRQEYWESATVEDAQNIPYAALRPLNKNGPVLMWAASATKDPHVIKALVDRGADVNEKDVIFTGTPLSGAAGYNSNPEIIDELVKLGADVNAKVGNEDKSPLIIAAEINPNTAIIESLIRNGASTAYRDKTGRNALEAAKKYGAPEIVEVLTKHTNAQTSGILIK